MSNRFKYTLLVLLVLIAAPLFAQTVTLKEAYIPLPGGGKAIYGSAGTQTYYQRQDGLGNIRITTTPSKAIGSSVGVSPFGENYDDDLPNGLIDMQFQGMGQESATAGGVAAGYGGVYVTPNRTYSAIQGRWLSPDPIPGDNAYMYVHNSPILRSDPSGLQDGGGDDGGDCDDGCISYDGGDDGGLDYSDPGIDFGDFGFSGDVGAPGFYGVSNGLYSPGGGRLYPSLVTPDAVIILVYRTPIHGLNDLLYNLPGGLANSPIVMVKGAVQQWGLMETGTPKQLWKELTYRPSWLGPAVAANNGTGFTLGIRAPGQTYSQCLAANSSTYSINNWLPSSAQNGATKFALGNDVSNALFGDANEGTAGLVVGAGVAAAPLGVGTAGTFGRRTASIFDLNLSGTTGPAPTILGETGAAGVVGWVSGAFELKLAADIGATAAEALNCIGHR
jgi:RHS repeat-associated protein